MDRNKLLALIVIIGIALGIIFYVLWFIILNRGAVVFEGTPPFTVAVGAESQICLESQCSFTFATGDYNYSLSKDGYYNRSGVVTISRGETTVVPIALEFIPEALEGKDYSIFNLPVGYSKFSGRLLDITLFNIFDSSVDLKKLPKKIEDIQFSPSGSKAAVFEKNKVSVYSTQDFSLVKLGSISDTTSVGWTVDEEMIYAVSFDDASKKDALKKVSLVSGASENLVYFLRDIDEYSIAVSPNQSLLAIADTTHSPSTLYIVDLESNSRTNIFEGFVIEVGHWSPNSDMLIFSAKGEDQIRARLWYWDSVTGEVNELPFKSELLQSDFNSIGEFYFITQSDFNVSGFVEPYMTEFVEEEEVTDYSLLISEFARPERLTLQKWLYQQNETFLIKDLLDSVPAVPDKIEVSEDDKVVRLLIGKKFFDIKLGE